MTVHYFKKLFHQSAFLRLRLLSQSILFLYIICNLSLKAENVIHNPDSSSFSQLANGVWYKIAAPSAGVYKVTYEDMQSMPFSLSGLSSSSIRVHGYGGMLPEIAGAERFHDLPEVSIMMFDGGDGTFNPGDYFIFYSPGPHSWRYNSQAKAYEFNVNIYSDVACYFITTGSTAGKRINQATAPSTVSQQIQYFHFRDVVNPELTNLIKSGRGWYGDFYDIITERDYTFTPFTPRSGSEINLRFSAVARSFYGSSFTLQVNGLAHQLSIAPVSSDFNSNYAYITTNRFKQPAPDQLAAKVIFNKLTSMDLGWLNFIEVNAEAMLNYTGFPYNFRNTQASGNVEYLIIGANSGVMVWDVTDQTTPANVSGTLSNDVLSFKALADTVREYHITEPGKFMTPALVGSVANQNLHGMGTPSLLVISPQEFMDEAIRLATFHANYDDLSVSVVDVNSIYNEFSSGAQDISAIRDFIRMLWNNASPSSLPRYVLLFGDASYDFKNRLDSNTNFIPTWQSAESLNPVNSFATDDFFVCINDNEGGKSSDIVDIGIGRLPVRDREEATHAVDKILHYITETSKVQGDWRNVITFVADDEDGNLHMSQADQIARMIDTTYRNYNVDKIFLDAYIQESTPGGQRSPDANAAINQRVNKGSLIINYTGHGGETGWTHEQILEVKDIVGWTNYDRLPVFMTATCEFSRYDDPGRLSGGELAFLNKKGGAIALFTTARPTYGTPNFSLARNFYNVALKPVNGSMPRLGDIIRTAKNQIMPDDNNKKFVLLGDPAMKMGYPALKVITTSIKNETSNTVSDTLRALQTVKIEGYIANTDDTPVTSFNGMITPTVFDKQSNIITLGSDDSSPMSFALWRNIIYKGRAEVKNGYFSFTFIVPRDIAYNFGQGKISYYATDGINDAAGNYSRLVIGGFTNEELNDHDGPSVKLFINDSSFREGGFTDENPILLAYISDSSGINTLGNSIGHDIVAILDDDTQSPWILNDYYESDLNTYKKGSIRFQMFNLEPGPHVLTLRLWDVNNNSTEVSTRFIVSPQNTLMLSELEAFPNPMRDNITFAIGHNQASKDLMADLSVYNLAGIKVASLKKSIHAEGYRSQVFEWDGRNAAGQPVSAGFYIANLQITTPEGYNSDKSVKIIITR